MAKIAPDGVQGGQYNLVAPVLADGQVARFQFDANGNLKVDIVAGSVAVVITPPTGALTDRSGTIGVGGTTQQLAAANLARQYLFVQNPAIWVGATESLFINFTAAASQSGFNSIELAPGSNFLMEGPGLVSTEQINVVAPTTGHPYIAKEG